MSHFDETRVQSAESVPGPEFTREVIFDPAYDHRDDPDGKRGARGVTVRLVLRGPLGAIVGAINTGWVARPLVGAFIRGQAQNRRHEPGVDLHLQDSYPTGHTVSSHSLVQREDWWMGPHKCDVLDGECYGDAGYAMSDDLLEVLVTEGSEGAWKYLESVYADWFKTQDTSPGGLSDG